MSLSMQMDWPTGQSGWSVNRQTISLEGASDRRLIGQPAPDSFRWTTKISLSAGRSAGVIFGASADGQSGYVARLDSRLGMWILAKLGPWPKEERLATFRNEAIDGATANLRVEMGAGSVRIFIEGRGIYPILEATKLTPAGKFIGLYGIDARAKFEPKSVEPVTLKRIQPHVPVVGEFTHFFDQSIGEKKPWYINDHCIIRGEDGWHMFGITHEQPANPMAERNFAHASSPTLLARPWTKQPFALSYDPTLGENHLWAPHVIKKGATYYMFYCAGSQRSNFHYRINLATSKDLKTWTRWDKNPVFEDFFDARDPMVLLVGDTYHLYYTANLDSPSGNHVVMLRTSKDLLKWSPARVAFVHPEVGTFGGPTESPFVVHFGDHFYLFVGPDGGYHSTKVYRSPNPYGWTVADHVATFPSHACEVVQDVDGKYYATDSGWDKNGVFLASLNWRPAVSK